MEDLRAEGRPVGRVVVKVRFAPFVTHQHAVTLAAPTTEERAIEACAQDALARFDLNRPVRLLGVRGEFAPEHR